MQKFRAIFIPILEIKAITVYGSKQNISKFFSLRLWCICLFKLYDIYNQLYDITTLTKFCCEISKSRVILRTVYTCNVKELEEVEKMDRN